MPLPTTGSVLVVDGGHLVSSLHDYLITISPEIDILCDRIARFVDQDVLSVEVDRSNSGPT